MDLELMIEKIHDMDQILEVVVYNHEAFESSLEELNERLNRIEEALNAK